MHMSLDDFKREVTRWCHRWRLSEDSNLPQTLVETLDYTNAELYPGIYVAMKTLLTNPVSTCIAERSFSGMKRLKTPLGSTMSDERLSSLAVLHVHKHKEVDVDQVITVCWEEGSKIIPVLINIATNVTPHRSFYIVSEAPYSVGGGALISPN